ncbi:Fur family transcriptional regulator, zinc uptake regulator [Shimia gijangensis]|uniref:Fur family transcriptional regulator, zinc uptake regulator n=1 Tax=Shimia gijangensis TaxID=1470563 RepID=A0A1M6NSP8_9RHOB|nr:transcriptional repressor [Shimia gijangensis]SHJ98675.1 Fur family transcriptional regulator, zinc uptake regulator [Shimia gijangensis]
MHDIGFEKHDHTTCVASGLQAAEAFCAAHKVQLTQVRRRVLEILLREHRAMGAYDILAILSQEGLGSQPPVAYRALDFLETHGFAHKIERLNAWLACTHPGNSHSPVFLICRDCGAVAEAAMPVRDLQNAARDAGFQVENTVIEAEGLCPTCQKANNS